MHDHAMCSDVALEMNFSLARSLTPSKTVEEVALETDATIREQLRLQSQKIRDQIQFRKFRD